MTEDPYVVADSSHLLQLPLTSDSIPSLWSEAQCSYSLGGWDYVIGAQRGLWKLTKIKAIDGNCKSPYLRRGSKNDSNDLSLWVAD